MKTREVPHYLKEFNRIFSQVTYRHEYVIVFDDFLSAALNYFLLPGSEGFDVSVFKRYSKEENQMIGSLVHELIKVYDKQIVKAGKDWFDPLGEFYEVLSSRGKKSALGQFFTPEPVVEFMSQINGDPEELTGKGYKISDPTCGSGRMLIAFHSRFPGNYTFGEDIDPICCKMTCLNMMVHGCEGEVIQHNALDPNDFVKGWYINPKIGLFNGLPHILPIAKKEDSFVYRMWQQQLKKAEQEKQLIIQRDKDAQIAKVGIQTSLF